MNSFFLSIILIIFLFIISGGIFFFFKSQNKKNILESLGMSLFLVRMPKHEKKEEGEKQDIKSLIGMVEQIYSNFLRLPQKGFFPVKPCVALEIASEIGGEDISFYIAVPVKMESNLEKIIQGVYSGAIIEKIPQDYTIFEPNGETFAVHLMLKKPVYFPLNTYKNLEGDPLSTITNSLSKIASNEGAAIQIILRPFSYKGIKGRGEAVISEMKQGKSSKSALAKVDRISFLKFLDFIFEILSGKKKEDGGLEKPLPSSYEESTTQAIQLKLQKPLMEANIRLVAAAQIKERAEEIVYHLQNSFSQFTSTFNELAPIEDKKGRLKKLIYNFSFRNFNKNERIVLNLEELASIYHFPFFYIESPHIKWTKTKEAAPPTGLVSEGSILLGKSVFRGEQRPVYFASRDDRRRHFYILGQTGTGKSSLLQEMIRQDIENGEGVGVIDPHGDLIEATLANIPKHRIEDVVLFEPFDIEHPCGLNMLEWDTLDQKDFAVSEMITIFSKLFPPEITGPMFEHYMRNAMLALMADKENQGTLVEIPRIFTDNHFMENRLSNVTDFLVKSFWQKEWAQTTGATRSDMLGYVVSKVGRFVENEMMRNIIGQSRSGFNLANIMNEGKIFLANLSKGLTGEMNSSLLGLILVSKMQIAAMKRGGIPQDQRKDFYLYIDEFQNFTTNSIATILSEARKYRLNLILSHQFIPQLTEEIRNAVIGNVGSIGAFRVGADDAEFLEKQFEPEFSKYDLLNIDNFQLIIKMMMKNTISSPFKIKTTPPQQENIEMVSSIKNLSKLKYSKPRAIVEKEILERSRLGEL
ncbi:type IV secretion system DNA-binding domain-containing protein [Patescibacteria group bacterium]|nr:type IV secretion system DNA-binding domain-containing protein [Patescibacteria group bacterium]